MVTSKRSESDFHLKFKVKAGCSVTKINSFWKGQRRMEHRGAFSGRVWVWDVGVEYRAPIGAIMEGFRRIRHQWEMEKSRRGTMAKKKRSTFVG